ncbi:MAG: hypothetical protein CMF61_00480 [Magnetococcales bacterium]|nr:hypothetical protein [Magnetococcales bacterium]
MVIKILVLAVIFYIGVCAFMFFRQERLLFPAHLAPASPDENYTSFKTDDQFLLETKIFRATANANKTPLLILFTGNAQNAILAGEGIWKGFEENINLATMNYRNYGNSEGQPTEKNIFKDAVAFTKFIKSEYPSEKVYLMGISLGTGIASYVASQIDVDGVILMTPYDSIVNVGQAQYPFLPVKFLIKHPFDTTLHIQNVQAPVAIMRAGNDKVILSERTNNLVNFVPNLAYDHTVPNMEHTEILEPQNRKLLISELKKAFQALTK